MRLSALSATTLALLIMATISTFAQAPSLADGVVQVSAGASVRVMRGASINADPLYCGGILLPVECRTRYETVQWLGYIPGSPIGVDATGAAYQVANQSGLNDIDFGDGRGTLIQRTGTNGVTEDVARLFRYRCRNPQCTVESWFSFITPFYMDVTQGRIVMLMGESVREKPNNNETDFLVGLVEISGLPQMFDILLTFVPGQQAMSILTPAHPDGFRSADSLQVWTGNVRAMPDWGQAQPLTCEAAANPVPGQVLTVADTLPDPAPGHGRYYLTASINGPDRRLGRQYSGGTFSARNPSGLPVCATP